MIRYGTNPIAWANDDDRTIGAHIPTEQILREAGEVIGFDGIEGGHRWPEDGAEIKKLLGRHGLILVSAWYSMELLTRSVAREIEEFQPHLAKLKANGCEVAIVCETSTAIHGDPSKSLSERERLSPEAMQRFGAKVEEFAAYVESQGLTLVYHHHMGTVVETPEEIDAFMAATGPATKLLFDAGHCYFGGGDPAKVLKKHVARVRHFHAKNVRPEVMHAARDADWSFLSGVVEGVFTVPGDSEGAIDFAPLLRTLAGAGYQGWLVIEAEQDPTFRNPLEYQTLGLRTLKEQARAAGLDKAARKAG